MATDATGARRHLFGDLGHGRLGIPPPRDAT
jgi:hypothetical protein